MITIIIPVHNGSFYTKQCIESICLDYVDEIIVVDNASKDDTCFILKDLPASVISLKRNVGFPKACNLALPLASSPYIYFLNNDTILNPTTITALLDRIVVEPKLGAVGSKVTYPNGEIVEAGGFFTEDAYQRVGDYDDFEIVDYCSACSLLVKRELIPNGFDERFSPGYYEDVDLCMQLKQKGYRTGYEPKSVIKHYTNTTSRQVLDLAKLIPVNKKKFIDKWASVHFLRNQED